MEARHHFLLISDNKEVVQWLQSTLHEDGEVIVSDSSSIERVIQLIDAVGARVVFCELSVQNSSRDAAFMEGLTAAKPMLPVVAMSETVDRQVILTALRSGARDFVSPDMRPSEVLSLIRRAISRDHGDQRSGKVAEGSMTAIVSARPGADAPMFALHLALALQNLTPNQDVLLLDLGVPAADTLHYLGIDPTYTFVDAIRSLRRLDDTLINAAFSKHASGLRVLAMPEDSLDVAQFTTADLYVLLSALRRHFNHIVLNLGGIPATEFLFMLAGRSDRVLLLVEQSVPSCKQNRTLLQKMRDNKLSVGNLSLVVDRYLPSVPPNAETISKGFGAPLLSTLPPSGMARLTMMNSGESLFESAPRDPYTVTVGKIAQNLLREINGEDVKTLKANSSKNWLDTLAGKLKLG
jgi:pilus assembly protein CpaE